MTAPPPVLSVRDLSVHFRTRYGLVKALDGVSYDLHAGETLGIVGESGSGKTMAALATLRLLPNQAQIISGQILFHGRDILRMQPREMRRLRGRGIAMIPQDPVTSLNPILSIGDQLRESLALKHREYRAGLSRRGAEWLRRVKVSDPDARLRAFPHQLSGGMRQRVVGAIAFSAEPQIVIADEPTTSLDATVQLQYLNLLQDLQAETGASVIFITHDFGIVAKICDRVAVMYAGRIVEQGSVSDVFDRPKHPYTQALIRSVPEFDDVPERLPSISGQPPAPGDVATGCSYAPRCEFAWARCLRETPPDLVASPGHSARCWLLADPERQS